MSSRARIRRLLALCVLAWLNLLIQPCLAQVPAIAAATAGHCDHADGHSHAPCPEMTAEGCVTSWDSTVSTTPATSPVRFESMVLLLPPVADAAWRETDTGDYAGPPLTIRYCSLRN